MSPSRVGQARTRAMLEAKVLTPDGGGGFAESWEAYATVWATVESRNGTERLEAGRVESRATQRLTIRRRADVSANHRVRIGARVLAIRAVLQESPQSPWMSLICEEGAPS